MAIPFGDIERKKRPDLRLVETQWAQTERTVFEAQFRIADSVLDAVAKGAPIKVRFSGQELSFPTPPQALRQEFAAKYAALLPPGLRKG